MLSDSKDNLSFLVVKLKDSEYRHFEVIYQTQDIQTPRRELKMRCAAEYF